MWEQEDILDAIKVVESRMHYYNDIRRHESPGYRDGKIFEDRYEAIVCEVASASYHSAYGLAACKGCFSGT